MWALKNTTECEKFTLKFGERNKTAAQINSVKPKFIIVSQIKPLTYGSVFVCTQKAKVNHNIKGNKMLGIAVTFCQTYEHPNCCERCVKTERKIVNEDKTKKYYMSLGFNMFLFAYFMRICALDHRQQNINWEQKYYVLCSTLTDAGYYLWPRNSAKCIEICWIFFFCINSNGLFTSHITFKVRMFITERDILWFLLERHRLHHQARLSTPTMWPLHNFNVISNRISSSDSLRSVVNL